MIKPSQCAALFLVEKISLGANRLMVLPWIIDEHLRIDSEYCHF